VGFTHQPKGQGCSIWFRNDHGGGGNQFLTCLGVCQPIAAR
jgi:hypothetical protein